MRKFLTIKKALIFLALVVLFAVISENIGNEVVMNLSAYLALVAIGILLWASLLEMKSIKVRRKKENINLHKEKIGVIESQDKFIIINFSLFLIAIVSFLLKGTQIGFFISYGGLLLVFLNIFMLLEVWSSGSKIKGWTFLTTLILLLLLLVLIIIYYFPQLTIYLESR